MDTAFQLLLAVIAALLAVIGFFLKRILDTTDRIVRDVHEMKPKVEVLWQRQFAESRSPLALNEEGLAILDKSGIKKLVDTRADQLIAALWTRKPENAYQLQEAAQAVLAELKSDATVLTELERGAFETGVDVDSVLWVGALYLRDLALPHFPPQPESGQPQVETADPPEANS